MTDKPVSHKRPVSRLSRVAMPHLKKAEPQRTSSKQNLRPLTSEEKREIIQRLGKGETARKIASEMGIPFVLVQRQQSRTTCIVGELEYIHLVIEDGKQAAALQIAGIRFSVPAAVYARADFLDFTFLEGTILKVQTEWNGENFVVIDAEVVNGASS